MRLYFEDWAWISFSHLRICTNLDNEANYLSDALLTFIKKKNTHKTRLGWQFASVKLVQYLQMRKTQGEIILRQTPCQIASSDKLFINTNTKQ